MARELSPAEAAKRIEKWAKVGIDYAQVQAVQQGLQDDRRDSAGRAPRESGRLARSIRIVRPSATSRDARQGRIAGGLAAGSRSRTNPIPQAGVLQTGTVGFPPRPATKRHVIRPRGSLGSLLFGRKLLAFRVGGRLVLARSVDHPGSRFHARPYLAIAQPRLEQRVDAGLQRSADQELG